MSETTDHASRTARGEALVHGYLSVEELAIAGPLMEALREGSRMGLFRKLLRWAAHALRATRALGRKTEDVLGQLVLKLDTATPATSVGAFTECTEEEAEEQLREHERAAEGAAQEVEARKPRKMSGVRVKKKQTRVEKDRARAIAHASKLARQRAKKAGTK